MEGRSVYNEALRFKRACVCPPVAAKRVGLSLILFRPLYEQPCKVFHCYVVARRFNNFVGDCYSRAVGSTLQVAIVLAGTAAVHPDITLSRSAQAPSSSRPLLVSDHFVVDSLLNEMSSLGSHPGVGHVLDEFFQAACAASGTDSEAIALEGFTKALQGGIRSSLPSTEATLQTLERYFQGSNAQDAACTVLEAAAWELLDLILRCAQRSEISKSLVTSIACALCEKSSSPRDAVTMFLGCLDVAG